MALPELNVPIPKRREIPLPTSMGPSKFPHSTDELKTIEYSSVPAGGELENDLRKYYTLLAAVASNSASEQDLLSLKSIMLKVRNYVLTEDDFNLMSDAVRTTQEYLRNSIEAADGNFELVSVLADSFTAQLNEWSLALQEELQKLAIEGGLGAPVIYGENDPGSSAIGYLWINDNLDDGYIAPLISFEEDGIIRVGDGGATDNLSNSDETDRELGTQFAFPEKRTELEIDEFF